MEDNGNGAFLCENCDSPQPQEAAGMERRKTPQDIRFDMYWLRVIKNEYTDNTKTSSKDEPDETTGGTDNG